MISRKARYRASSRPGGAWVSSMLIEYARRYTQGTSTVRLSSQLLPPRCRLRRLAPGGVEIDDPLAGGGEEAVEEGGDRGDLRHHLLVAADDERFRLGEPALAR